MKTGGVDVIREMDQIAGSGELVGVDVVNRWRQSMDSVEWAHFAGLYFDGSFVFSNAARWVATNGLIHNLIEIAEYGGDELTSGEALEYLRELFWILWEAREENMPHLDQMKSGFAALLQKWPAAETDLVILIVLEHLFTKHDIRAFFAEWSAQESLRDQYNEAVHLSEGRIEPIGPDVGLGRREGDLADCEPGAAEDGQ